MASERSVRVILTAQAQGYIDGMEKAAKATRETGSAAEKLADQGRAFELMGRSAMAAGGLVLGGLTLATKAAIDWDSAWAGVTKTVDGSPEQLAAVEAGLRGLTSVLPASHEEIAAVAEAAGQLGIETPNVVAFTKTMIDLGETTNLAASDAATQLARFMTVMGTAQEDVSGLGSALVALGNNYATTEGEIMAMAMRLSGAGAQINLSEGQVLGLSTALSSVGIEAEAGGSAMSKVMIDIASSVDKGGDRVKQFAEVAGMSADQFSAKWKSAPGEALAAFVKGLANAEAQGKSTFGILEDLGITEVRMRDALLRSASAADQFSEAMEMGNRAMSENTALTDEAAKRYETTAAKIDIMKNRLNDALIGIGEKLLPIVDGGAESVTRLADAFSGLGGPMETVVAWGGAIIGTGILGAGIWMAAVPKIAEYRKAMVDLNLAGGRLDKTLSVIGKGAALAGIAAAVIAVTREAAVDVGALTNALERNAEATEMVGAAADSVGNRGWGNLINDFREFEVSADDVSSALTRMNQNWFEQTFLQEAGTNLGHLKNTGDTLRVIGDEISKLAAVDLGAAQESMAKLADEYSLSSEQMTAFINNSPELKKALESQAAALGLSTSEADLLKIALGEVGPAAKKGAEGADTQKKSLEELAGVAQEVQQDVAALADEIRNFGSAQFDVETATIKFHGALADLDEQLASGQGSLDVTTEAGRNTMSAMLDVASSTNDYAASVAALGGSTEDIQAALESGRQKIIDTRIALGDTEEQAKAYADQLIATPETVKTRAELDTANATSQYWAWRNQIEGGVITIRGQMAFAGGVNPSAALNHANGAVYENGVKTFANSGFEPGIYPYTPGGIHKFAEEYGEAYISMDPARIDRSRQVWVESGNRLGVMDEVLSALRAATEAAASPGMQLSQTIQPAPGMSEAQIASIAADKISFAMRAAR